MTPLRALILEDEWPARSYLVELLQQTEKVEVVAAVSTTSEAQQALEPSAGAAIDVAFVDVRLAPRKGDESGLDWVRATARGTDRPQFVLATAHGQHALEAFQLGVVDYLLKPFTLQRVIDCVGRLAQRRPFLGTSTELPLRIAARREHAIVFLDLDEVWACEAADRQTFVHSARGRFDLDLTLSAIGASFGRTLLRVHRNWLVNPTRVVELQRETGETSLFVGVVAGSQKFGVRVPVAKERVVPVREALLAGTRGIRLG
jgi:two-component system, LytTR family, response regulator LytT